MMPDPIAVILLTPLVTAAILAVLPGYRAGAALNVFASLVSLLFALTLLWERPATGPYLLVDDLNIVIRAAELLYRPDDQRVQRFLYRP
jgi:hydrogenase-4 component F